MENHLVHVSYGKGFRNTPMHGNILPLEITPTPLAVVKRPVVVQSTIQSSLVGNPDVTSSLHTLRRINEFSAKIIQVEWEERVCSI